MGNINKQEKTRRASLLAQQNNMCALCNARIPIAFRLWYVEKQNAIICQQCNHFMNVYAASIRRGVTAEVLAAFLAQEPAQEPTPEPVSTMRHTRKQLTQSHLEMRQRILDGRVERLTLEDWERRAGVYGTNYVETHGLEPATEPVRVPEPEWDLIDGVWISKSTGEPRTE